MMHYETIDDYYKNVYNWDMEKLWKLRNEIILGSMLYDDYENSFGIPKNICCNFFDGFIELCFIMESESKNGLTELTDIYNKYDNAESLWDYFCSIEYPFEEI